MSLNKETKPKIYSDFFMNIFGFLYIIICSQLPDSNVYIFTRIQDH